MPIHHIQLSSWSTSLKSGIYRTPDRPEKYRQSTFEDEYDYTTLAYDLFTDTDGQMCLLCPPRDDLAGIVEKTGFSDLTDGALLEYEVVEYKRTTYLTFKRSVPSIIGKHPFGTVTLTNQPNLSKLLENRNVVFTMQKNNPLNWIADWAYYYIRYHGTNAFVIYDNASDDYDATSIYETINSISDDLIVMVIHWPFKYGPSPTVRLDFKSVWSQRAAMNHARLRLLGNVRAALNVDIDEYVWCDNGSTIFDVFQRSDQDVVKIAGYQGLMPKNLANRSIRDVLLLGSKDQTKWICHPSICRDSYWLPHTVVFAKEDDAGRLEPIGQFDISHALFFHLHELRTVNTCHKVRCPKDEMRNSGKLKMKSLLQSIKLALKLIKTILTVPRKGNMISDLAFFQALGRPRHNGNIKIMFDHRTGNIISVPGFIPGWDYPERKEVKIIFDHFLEAVKNVPTQSTPIQKDDSMLKRRLWAGELFKNHAYKAALNEMRAIVSAGNSRPSYTRFIKLIRDSIRKNKKWF